MIGFHRVLAMPAVVLIVVGTCWALWAANPSEGKSRASAQPERPAVWPWPFKQNEKQVGVEYVERIVNVPDAEIREWEALVPGEVGGGYTTDLQGRLKGIIPRRTGYFKQIVQGKLLAVRQKSIRLTIAGRKEPFWQLKTTLRPTDREYVKDIEIQLAKKMGELADEKQGDEAKQKTPEDSKLRTWTRTAGDQIEAEFAGIVKAKVRLKRPDGSIIYVPLSALSKEDQQFVQNAIRQRRRRKVITPGPTRTER